MLKLRVSARSNRGATEIAQFPLTLYCLFLVLFLPILNLVTLLIAGATAYLCTNDLVAKAATQSTFAQALNAMAIEAYNFQSNALAQFVKMSPQGGYTGCGNDLYVLATSVGGAGVQSSAPDQSLTTNIDTSKNFYEMQVISSYTVSPLVSLAALPLLGSIPGLGQPVTLSFAASRPIEHPGGMQNSTNGDTNGGGAVTAFSRVSASPNSSSGAANATWRNPAIYKEIQSAGQTIVAQNVFIVQGNNPTLTPSGVTIAPGETIWLDTQAVGVWSPGPELGYASGDANGCGPTASPPITENAFPPIGPNALVGQIGTNPGFFVGTGQTNYSPSGTGPLSMMMNDKADGYQDNTGAQMVRVIVTQ